MNNNLRGSGIDIIGDIPWGTHIGQLYSSKADFYDVLAPYIKSGLINNELCIWIYAENTSYEEVKGIISKCVKDIDVYIESGQLKIIPHTEWYIKDNSFNEVRVNRQWNNLIRFALDNGFDGLRAIGDTFWLEKSHFRTFADYEHNVDKIISELPFIVICLYDINKVDIFEVADIIKNHSYVIARRGKDMELIKNVELLIKEKQVEESEERYTNLVGVEKALRASEEKYRRLFEEQKRDLTGMSRLQEISTRLIQQNDMDSLLGEIIEAAIEITYADMGNIQMLNDKHELKIVASRGFDKTFLDYFNTVHKNNLACGTAMVKGGRVIVEDITKNPAFMGEDLVAALTAGIRAVQSTPLFSRSGRLIGIFSTHYRECRCPEERELLLLDLLARQAADHIERMQAEEMKDDFLSLISHEFKTPLTVINSAVQAMRLICKDELSDKANKYLGKILQNSNRQLKLVNNLLDITRINAGHIKMNLTNIDIIIMTRTITESIMTFAEQKGIRLSFSSTLREKIIGIDEEKYERILLNLLSNAIKFTPKGKSITVRASQKVVKGKCRVCIQVKDQGIGIPQDKQQLIFERFGQVDSSLSRQAEGTGIGLSLVKTLVEIMGGEIALESEEGKGSTFTIQLLVTKVKETLIEKMLQEITDNRLIQATAIEFSDI